MLFNSLTFVAFFAIVLLVCGWLYFASVRRENNLRAHQDRFARASFTRAVMLSKFSGTRS